MGLRTGPTALESVVTTLGERGLGDNFSKLYARLVTVNPGLAMREGESVEHWCGRIKIVADAYREQLKVEKAQEVHPVIRFFRSIVYGISWLLFGWLQQDGHYAEREAGALATLLVAGVQSSEAELKLIDDLDDLDDLDELLAHLQHAADVVSRARTWLLRALNAFHSPIAAQSFVPLLGAYVQAQQQMLTADDTSRPDLSKDTAEPEQIAPERGPVEERFRKHWRFFRSW